MQHMRQTLSQAQRAVNDTFNSLKAVFEKHNVVLTIGGSIASAGAAWAGYAARQVHQKKVEDRLNNLEHVMTNVHQMEEEQVKALVHQVGVSYKACAATAGTTLVIGYGLGFRGGRWYTIQRYQKQQKKLLQLEKASKPGTTSAAKSPAAVK
ncbi:hypothetical protein R1flu_025821 [Riccia fluitans]|uniref:Uncharacterized protein n=1 Tax=Riccia fluitans TaxID=41844 RepID=A0ABD1XZ97_9MARC